ncbi:hypothetical protein POVCU1_046430 [Plasmodium ovale curtisi]|uniref:Uncharacterized protein n=1 Tax=Plasmodium ovale curtisi TaxID=864141 RepID=A0A1A8X3Z1_PLAOA|nr:hypothetical protein POVCU1_046430 [Plasmodium ovale curtisi]
MGEADKRSCRGREVEGEKSSRERSRRGREMTKEKFKAEDEVRSCRGRSCEGKCYQGKVTYLYNLSFCENVKQERTQWGTIKLPSVGEEKLKNMCSLRYMLAFQYIRTHKHLYALPITSTHFDALVVPTILQKGMIKCDENENPKIESIAFRLNIQVVYGSGKVQKCNEGMSKKKNKKMKK